MLSISHAVKENFNFTHFTKLHHVTLCTVSPSCSNLTISASNTVNTTTFNSSLSFITDLNITNALYGIIDGLHVDRPIAKLTNFGQMTRSEMRSISDLFVAPNASLNLSNLSFAGNAQLYTLGTVRNCSLQLSADTNHSAYSAAESVVSAAPYYWYISGLLANNTVTISGGNVTMIVEGVLHNNSLTLYSDSEDTDTVDMVTLNELRMSVHSNGSAAFNSINATLTALLYIESMSLFSGWIHSNMSCMNLTVHCENMKDINRTCRNLTIFAPDQVDHGLESTNRSATNRTTLECVGYGCQSMDLWALDGMDDIDFVSPSGSCPCSVDCLVSCLGEWNLFCSNSTTERAWDSHSVFADNMCSGPCCGDIVNLTMPAFECKNDMFTDVVCQHDVGLDIALLAAVAGGAVILMFFLFLGVRSICRKVKQKELRRQYEKRQERARREQGSKVMALLPDQQRNGDDEDVSRSPGVIVN